MSQIVEECPERLRDDQVDQLVSIAATCRELTDGSAEREVTSES